MLVTLFELTVPRFRRALGVIVHLLDRAEAHFRDEGRNVSDLAGLRLAPDMNPFFVQIASALDNSVGATALLRGLPHAPVSGLTTLADVRAALARALAELSTLAPGDFEGAEDREIVLPSPKGARHFPALDYVLNLALPNVQFHTTIVYALLRAEGLDIGKRDFLGELPPRRPSRPG
ncbi:MAG: DUF1993 family protein [Alphaproteobacteria bacterium]|jgi:hypothetical protein